ncbi:hypothetical protein ACPVPU_12585 [Sphingomonas sp. CJ99]
MSLEIGFILMNDLPMAKLTRGKDEKRRELEKLMKLTAQLYNHIETMHLDSRSEIDIRANPRGERQCQPAWSITSVQFDVRRLGEAAAAALDDLSPSEPRQGRKPSVGANHVAHVAIHNFESLTNQRATVRTDHQSAKAYGPFVEFLADVFAATGLRASAESAAKLAIDERRKGIDPLASGAVIKIIPAKCDGKNGAVE